MNTKIVLVSFHNGGNFLYKVSSNEEITMDRVWNYFEETEGISESRDSIEIFDVTLSEINLDNQS